MTTATQAIEVLKAAIKAALPVHPITGDKLPAGWLGDDALILDDEPSPFVYTVFSASRSGVIEIGGGRGANRHRNPASATIFVFVPIGWGLAYATDYAEAFAHAFRSYAAGGVTCDSATVHPGGPGSEIAVPGLDSEVGNYFWAACDVEYHFDLIG